MEYLGGRVLGIKNKFCASFVTVSLVGSMVTGFIPASYDKVLGNVAYCQESQGTSILQDAQSTVNQIKYIMGMGGLSSEEKGQKIEELVQAFQTKIFNISTQDSTYLLQGSKLITDELLVVFKKFGVWSEPGYKIENTYQSLLSTCYPHLSQVSQEDALSYYKFFMSTLKSFADYYQQNYTDAFSHYSLVLIAASAGKGVSTVRVNNNATLSPETLNVEKVKQSIQQLNQTLLELGVNDQKVETSVIVDVNYTAGEVKAIFTPEAITAMKNNGIENVIIKSKMGSEVKAPLKDFTGKVMITFKKDNPIAGGDGRISVDAPVYTFSLSINDKIISSLPESVLLTLQIPDLYPYSEENLQRKLELSKLSAYMLDKNNRWVILVTDYHVGNGFLTFKAKGSGSYSGFVSNKTFADVGPDYWAKDAIEFLYAKGIISGVSDKLFEPERNITRAEFAKLLVKTFELEGSQDISRFTDVKPSDWFYKDLAIAYNYGIVKGDSESSFAPNRNITREEMVTMMVRALNLKGTWILHENEPLENYKDVNEVSDWAKPAMEIAVDRGIIKGTTPNTISPKNTAIRAEAAKMIDTYYETTYSVPYY